MNEIQQIREITAYKKAIPNIDRACSSVIENSIAIFLPLTRIDKSNVYQRFIENNQILVIENDLFDKVEVRGRLLGQIHKDVLEALLTMPKTFSKATAQFKIKTTAYQLLKRMNRYTSDKKWVMQKIDEIKECGVKLHYKNSNGISESFNFGFISSIKTLDKTNIEVWFSPEYTHFLAHNELLDYSDYVPQIISLNKELKAIQEQIGIKRGLNSEFIKAVVRHMLIHNGKESKIKIENFISKLNLEKIMSSKEIETCAADLKRKEVVGLLEKNFGITLISDNKTIVYNAPEDKKKYHIQKTLDLK